MRDGKAAHFAVRLVDAFEETWGGRTLLPGLRVRRERRATCEQMLDEERETHRRTKVGADAGSGGLGAARHLGQGVHGGRSPRCTSRRSCTPISSRRTPILIKDPSIGAGYQLKLIDMDFSLLADRRAPWHGYQGYVGTDNYRSPEHLTRGAVPVLASDVFTCGLILYELLAGVHPYWQEDQAEYAKRVRAYAAKPPALLGVMPRAGEQRRGERDAPPLPLSRSRRATDGRGEFARRSAAGRRPTDAAAAARAASPAARRRRRQAGAARCAAHVGSHSARGAGWRIAADRRAHRDRQGGAAPRSAPTPSSGTTRSARSSGEPDGQWMVTPAPATVNETLVNGSPSDGATRPERGRRARGRPERQGHQQASPDGPCRLTTTQTPTSAAGRPTRWQPSRRSECALDEAVGRRGTNARGADRPRPAGRSRPDGRLTAADSARGRRPRPRLGRASSPRSIPPPSARACAQPSSGSRRCSTPEGGAADALRLTSARPAPIAR